MIINNKQSATPPKVPPGQAGNEQNTSVSSPPPPPAYTTTENTILVGSGPSTLATHVAMNPATYRSSESAAVRFLKAFCIALLVWFIAAMFLESVVDVAFGHRHWHGDWNDTPGRAIPDINYGTPSKCISDEGWTFESYLPGASGSVVSSPSTMSFRSLARTSYNLPVDAEKLFLVARGALTSGSVHIAADGASDSDVKVDITVSYSSREAFDSATVCLLQRERGQHGVGMFTPHYWPHPSSANMIQFDVLVHLPTSSDGSSPLVIKDFETDLNNHFPHTISDLSYFVAFRSLRLKTSNAPISVTGIYADHAEIDTSNSPITGTFNTSTSLKLRTSNAPIGVKIGMNSPPDSMTPTELTLRTSNGVIDATIGLYSLTSAHEYGISGGRFSITSTTSNARSSLKVIDQPLLSTLNLNTRTSNSPASLNLHPSFEGNFWLQSSRFSPRVDVSRVEDPSGEGRERDVNLGQISEGVVKGYARWEQGGESQGTVQIRTSNSPAALRL